MEASISEERQTNTATPVSARTQNLDRRIIGQPMLSQKEIEHLYAFEHVILRSAASASTPGWLVEEVVKIFEVDAAALYHSSTGAIFRAGRLAALIPDEDLIGSSTKRGLTGAPPDTLSVTAVFWNDNPIGSLAILGGTVSQTLLKAIADGFGFGMAKSRAVEEIDGIEAAQKSQELKSALLDALAHEMKSPLAAIKIAVSVLQLDSPEIESQKPEMLSLIAGEADRLSRWVDEALQFARIEAGMLHLHKKPQDLKKLISDILKELTPTLHGRPVRLVIPDYLPDVKFDLRMMRKVLNQLLDNALKYSPRGSPLKISARLRDNTVEIGVTDYGVGIAQEEQERIFEKYYRGTNAESIAPGTGLGLASARYIVEAHGGSIRVSSRLGQRTTFYFSLPVATERTPPLGEYLSHAATATLAAEEIRT